MALRPAIIAALVVVLCTVPQAVSAAPVTITVQTRAKVVKPLTVRSIQDLDLGTLALSPGSWSGATVQLSRTGAFACPANVTCSGATQVAVYTATGSNGETATIIAPDIVLVNQSDATKTLTMQVDSPASVTFTNSGSKGVNFPLGGSITLDSDTSTGVYLGTFNVSVEYQ